MVVDLLLFRDYGHTKPSQAPAASSLQDQGLPLPLQEQGPPSYRTQAEPQAGGASRTALLADKIH